MAIENEEVEVTSGGEGGEGESADLRSQLESAFDAAEQDDGAREGQAAEEVQATPREGETQAQATQRERDEAGRFKKAAAKAAAAAPVPPVADAAAAPQPGAQTPPQAQPQAYKPPQAWKPAARELLAKLPPEFKPILEEVTRREGEIAKTLNDTAEVRRGFDMFRQVIAPYEAFIRAENSDPYKAVDNMMRTAVVLRTAPQQTRVGEIAKMFAQFAGLDDTSIGMLDEALAALRQGRQPGAGGAAGGQPAYRDPRVDDLLSRINEAARTQQEQAQAQAQADLQKFVDSHEFFADVKDHMAKLMKAGLAEDYETAYNTACKLHPEISGVLAQREAAEKARKVGTSTQRARAAASSVRSTPGGGITPPPDAADLRAAIDAAWDKAAGSR